MLRATLASFISLVLNLNLNAQMLDFSGYQWQIKAQSATVESYRGRQCVLLTEGVLELTGADFTNGVIEFDISISRERGFHGVQWRLLDENTHEEFYLRPHQSGHPDATQYTPVYYGLAGWQLYHGDGFSSAVTYDFDDWMHVKVVVAGRQGEIYVQDMSSPALIIHEMKQEIRSGALGLKTSFGQARFADFTYRTGDVELSGEIKTLPAAPAGTIMEWQVSDAFDGKDLENAVSLTPENLTALSWHQLECEKSGLANLARIQGISENKNTVFVKTTLHADQAVTKKLSFGYSDTAVIFLNGKALYSGQNIYRSRDFRYLGTIGYFDTVFLPLQPGDNELVVAVGENFGGWGIQARVENPSGVAVK